MGLGANAPSRTTVDADGPNQALILRLNAAKTAPGTAYLKEITPTCASAPCHHDASDNPNATDNAPLLTSATFRIRGSSLQSLVLCRMPIDDTDCDARLRKADQGGQLSGIEGFVLRSRGPLAQGKLYRSLSSMHT